MLQPGTERLATELVEMVLVALWAAPPLLLLGYIRKALIARRIAPDIHPRMFECAELDRVVQQYDRVSHRLAELRQKDNRILRSWRTRNRSADDPSARSSDELEELESQEKYLLSTIMTLRRRPAERLRFWLHIKSAQFALGQALVTYAVTFALTLVLVFQLFAPNGEFVSDAGALEWYPFDAANAIAVGFAVLITPLLYLTRRITLRRRHDAEFCIVRQLAAAAYWTREPLPADVAARNDNWFKVLGVQKSASAEDVRKAYKTLIKQSHPDRVQDLSPALKELAEAETKKLNTAYRQALSRAEQ